MDIVIGVDDSSTYQIKYDSNFHFGDEGVGLAIKTDGNVGIGTTTPAGKLEIANASSVTSYQDHANTSIIMRNPTSTADFNSSITWTDHTPNSWGHQSMLGITGNCGASHGLSLWGFNGRRISLCSNDNTTDSTPWDSPSLTVWQNKVGIGTTTPRCLLNVNTNGMSNSHNTIPTGVGSINITTSLFLGKSNGNNTSGNLHNYWGLLVGTLWNGRSYIYSGHSNNSSYYDLLLNPLGGRVGIGTTSPEGGLHVANYYDHGSSQVGNYFFKSK